MRLIISLIYLVILALPSVSSAQEPGSTLWALSANKVFARDDFGFGEGVNEYTWKVYANDIASSERCIEVNAENPNWYDIDDVFLLSNSSTPGLIQSMRMESWENDCGGRCSFDRGTFCRDDEGYCDETFSLNLFDYEPGISHTTERTSCNGRWGIEYGFIYNPPVPEKPDVDVSVPDGNICHPSPWITLSVNTNVKESFHHKLDLIWEYKAGSGPWRHLNTRKADQFDLILTNIRSLEGLQDITENTAVLFRVTTRINSTNSTFPSPVSNAINLSPLSAEIESISTSPSCPNGETGSVTFEATRPSGYWEFIWTIFEGHNATPCDPENPASCSREIVDQGETFMLFGTRTLTIENLPKGQYTLMLLNEGGTDGSCSDTQNFTVGEITDLRINTVQSNRQSCHDVADGSIRVTISGGRPGNKTFTISGGVDDISRSNFTGVFSDLTHGTFSIRVRDGCGQEETTEVTLSPRLEVIAEVESVSSTCDSPANGIANISIADWEGDITNADFEYTLFKDDNPTPLLESVQVLGALEWSIIDLSSGNYRLEVIDNEDEGCDEITTDFTINVVSPLIVETESIEIQQISCFNKEDGKVTIIDANDGFNYFLTNNESGDEIESVDGVFENLSNADYSLTITRKTEGCDDLFEYADVIEIRAPVRPGIILSKTDISCFGETDGSISSTIENGDNHDEYTWQILLGTDWLDMSETGPTVSNLAEGTYRLKINNNKDCEILSEEVSIIEPNLLVISQVDIIDDNCSDGNKTVIPTITGGRAPYLKRFTNPGGDTFETSDSTIELPNDTYQLEVIDASGCVSNYTEEIEIEGFDAIQIDYTISDYNGVSISCKGGSDGFVSFDASGGGGTFMYSFSGSDYSEEDEYSDISAGVYVISVVDQFGCDYSEEVSFTEPNEVLSINSVTVLHSDCDSNTGSVEFDIQGGTGPYTYFKNEDIGQVSSIFENLPPGAVSFVIEDQNGCSINYTTNVLIEDSPLSVTDIQNESTICTSENGLFQIEASGGIEPYLYAIDNGESNELGFFTDLSERDYLVIITDASGCRATHEVSIGNEIPEINFEVIERANPICKTDNGSIELMANGGEAPYTYTLNETANESGFFEDLGAGIHRVFVVDKNGCESFQDFEFIVVESEIEIDLVNKEDVECSNDASGIIHLNASGLGAPFTYSINGGLPRNNGLFTQLEMGEYVIEIEDSFGCVVVYNTNISSKNEPILISSNVIDVSCQGGSDGSIELLVEGGAGEYTFNWEDTADNASFREELTIGTYSVTVSDDSNCTHSFSFTIKEPEILTTSIEASESCFGESNGSVTLLPQGGTPPYIYSDETGNMQESSQFLNLSVGTHSFQVIDANNCSVTATAEIVEPDEKPVPDFIVANRENALDTLLIKEVSVPEPDSVLWFFDESIHVISMDNPLSPEISVPAEGSYLVQMVGYFKGCEYSYVNTLNIRPANSPLEGARSINPIAKFVTSPNPSNGQFAIQFELNESQPAGISIYDISGFIQYENSWDDIQEISEYVDLSDVKACIYNIKLVTESEVRVIKVLIKK